MNYKTTKMLIDQYEKTGSNQHGARYKKRVPKYIQCCTMTAIIDDVVDMRNLAVLSYHLQVPLTFNSDTTPQTVSIEICGAREVHNGL